MLNSVISKPILRLSVAILVHENLLKLSSILCKDINRRNYARWSTRKPSKVFDIDGDVSLGSLVSKDFYQSEYGNTKSYESKKPKYKGSGSDDVVSSGSRVSEEFYQSEYGNSKSGESKSEGSDELLDQRVKNSPQQFDYEVLEEHDSTFSKLMTHVGNRKMRRKHDLMMLEGKRLNLDALKAGLKPKKLFFTQQSVLEELNLPPNTNIPLYKIPYKTVQLWSKLDTPPGIIGFYSIPKRNDITPVDTLPIKVLCDNVRDPGNLGAIIRVAASVGCNQILLMQGSTDPWDSKVLRSASGGHFHIPIQMDLTWGEGEHDFILPSDRIFLADSHMARHQCNLPLVSYHDVDFSKSGSVVVIIGGETEGLSKEALRLGSRCGGSRLYIPLSNCVESLNSGCALSVILFEIKRQFLVNGNITNTKKESSYNTHDVESIRSSN